MEEKSRCLADSVSIMNAFKNKAIQNLVGHCKKFSIDLSYLTKWAVYVWADDNWDSRMEFLWFFSVNLCHENLIVFLKLFIFIKRFFAIDVQ